MAPSLTAHFDESALTPASTVLQKELAELSSPEHLTGSIMRFCFYPQDQQGASKRN